MPFSDYARNKIGDALFRGQTLALPAVLYFSLHTGTTPAAGNEFAVANGYTRIALPTSLTAFKGTHGTTSGVSTGTGGQFKNAVQLAFGTPSPGAWADVAGVGVWDASSGGNLWLLGALTTPKAAPAGVPVLIDIDSAIFVLV